MKNAVLRGYICVVIASLCVMGAVMCYVYSGHSIKQAETNLLETLQLIDHCIDYNYDLASQAYELDSHIPDDDRLTIIRTDGTVIADTKVNSFEEDNHLTRNEVQEAIKKGYGTEIRYSTTMDANLMYVAIRSATHSGYILRLAEPYHGRLYFASALLPALILSFIVSIILSIILSDRMSSSITKPLREIGRTLSEAKSYSSPISLKDYKYEEINAITQAINLLSHRVERTIEDIHFEKKKTGYILDNMQEGLILLDDKREVMIINKAAMEVLDCQNKIIGKSILYYTHNVAITEGIERTINTGIEQIFDITDKRGRIYSIIINRVKASELKYASDGVIIFMPEVTKDREAENMRQEFFSNASHELKTPITSIQGYAELLTSGIKYTPEQQEEFLQRIKTEAGNMTGLINDILTISRLESGSNAESESPVSISLLIQDIFNSVEPMAKEKNVSLYTNCGSISVKADYKKLYQLANNLIVNAVKYNKQGGSVTVTAGGNGVFTLQVKDTGIGIPADSKNRVFERFYRVDKGRSKKTAGTGLGLSIVKHVVNFYHGNIKLESKLDVGTDITVMLPIEIIN